MFLPCKKIGMTQIFSDRGEVVPVTVVLAGPCYVTQIKTEEKDGYEALQLAFEDIAERKVNKPERGHFAKAGITPKRYLTEYKTSTKDYEIGQKIDISLFSIGDKIKVTGKTKGKGFAGGVKRHGWSGGRATHGSRFHRRVGSIGASAYPGKVFKGKTMPGQMGNEFVCQKGLLVVDIDEEKGLLFIKGSIPGPNKGIVYIEKY